MFSNIFGFVLFTLLVYVKFIEPYVAMNDLIQHKYYVHNRSPKDIHIYIMRHVIVHDQWEEYQDVYQGIDIPANDSSTNYQLHIRHADSIEEWTDWWVMLFFYDGKNYTAEKPFYCRLYEHDTKSPVQVIVDFNEFRMHVAPPVSANCSTKIWYVPDKPNYDYNDYPRFQFLSTGKDLAWW